MSETTLGVNRMPILGMKGIRTLRRYLTGDPLPVADVMQFEPLARRRLSRKAYDYVSTGGADQITMSENRQAFARLRLSPDILRDMSHLDTRTSLLGHQLPHPIFLAPIAYHRWYHPEGELATARGASESGAVYVISSFTTTAIDEIARSTQGTLWFQLYFQHDRAFTKDMVQRAVAHGCKAICVTVDSVVLGARYAQLSFGLPKGVECVHLRGLKDKGALGGIYEPLFDPSIHWRDIDWLRSFAGVPVILKGILGAEDGRRAVECGVDGVIVSNHGGRNLDQVPASIDALPRVVEAIAGQIPVMLDSGIRRGTDVLIALALGARAVFLGRPYIYGLAAGGSKGVARVISIVRNEFERAMALTGRHTIGEIDSSVLWKAEHAEASRLTAVEALSR